MTQRRDITDPALLLREWRSTLHWAPDLGRIRFCWRGATR